MATAKNPVRTVYRIVDADGDEINPELFKPGVEIPVTVRSMQFGEGVLTVTLEYLHGKGK